MEKYGVLTKSLVERISYELNEGKTNMMTYNTYSSEYNSSCLEMPFKPRINDPTKELMLELVASQNADGSIGDEKGLGTSYFIIAMILYDNENKPYTNQIKKGIFYLLNEHERELEAYIALKLAFDNNIYREMDIEDRIDIMEKIDLEGNRKYLYNCLINDIEEFSSILFSKSMEKQELIYYLFDKI